MSSIQGTDQSSVSVLLPLIQKWEHKYNYVRPHQSLNYLTPMAYFNNYQKGRIPTKDFILLQT
ncbi:MAG: transposase [Candidatus Magasanikbacteria bacterium]|nr:transposase [Candidatus Magasanikbacteria bacterium]